MSLRPGIGADFMHEVASAWMEFDLDAREDDVPSSLREGGRMLPLGRYLRGRLRELTGKEKNAPASTLRRMEEEMRPLREAARADQENPSFKSKVVAASEGRRRSMVGRRRIFDSRKKL